MTNAGHNLQQETVKCGLIRGAFSRMIKNGFAMALFRAHGVSPVSRSP